LIAVELKRRNAVFEDDNRNLEAELQQLANSLLNNRLAPVKAELERLQATFAEANARLLEQIQPPAKPEETSGLATQVQTWLAATTAKAEQNYQERLRTELENAREELSVSMRQQFEADLQSKLEQSNLVIRREAEAEIEQLREQIVVLTDNQSLAQATTPPATSFHYGQLKSAIETIDEQRTQSETLTTLLQLAAQFSPRVAFYVVKSGEAVGWKAAGFENGLTDETVRALGVSIQTPSLLGDALNSQRTAVALNPSQAEIAPILGRFSHPVPQGVVAVPLVVRGKAAAVLYADSGSASDDAVQLEALEALVHVASMAIELLPVRRNAPEVARPPQTAAPAPVPAYTPETSETPAADYQAEISDHAAAAQAETTGQPVSIDRPGNTSYESAPAAYVADPTTDRLDKSVENESSQSDFVPAPTEDEVSSIATVEPSPEIAPQSDVGYDNIPTPIQPEPAYAQVAEPTYPQPSTAAAHEGEEDGPSIFDRLRAEAAESMLPSQNPGLSIGGYVPPDSSSNSDSGMAKSGTLLPEWMQRLQDEQPTPAPAQPASPPPASSWSAIEDTFSAAPPLQPPAPPTPPPFRAPSLSEFRQPTNEDADTENLPNQNPNSAIPFQVDAPSVRVVGERRDFFNTPSEPPRYAAPSLSVSNAATETEVRAHNDARRFARLLVSEIKLYNAAKVNEGRRQTDLYDRLKDEIDRSRKVYDKRVSPAVAAKFDYFYDELVQTLAEGDSSKLGINCPGPVVLTP
jgi:hypothetical protein